MKFQDLHQGQVYYLPIRILRILPIQDRIRICQKTNAETGAAPLAEEAAAGYPFPPYCAIWDGRCRYLSQDVWQHLMTAEQIAAHQNR